MISNFYSRTEAAPSLLSVIHSESSKTEQVTMKANFIYFWSVVSEFGIFWESWTIFELSCMYWQQWLQKTETQLCNQCCQYKSAQKEPKIVQFSQKKSQIDANSDVQKKRIFYYKFRFYTSRMNEICLHCYLLGFFLDSEWITYNFWVVEQTDTIAIS